MMEQAIEFLLGCSLACTERSRSIAQPIAIGFNALYCIEQFKITLQYYLGATEYSLKCNTQYQTYQQIKQ